MKKIVALYLNVEESKGLEMVEVGCDTNEDFYNLISCETIDIVSRKIGGKEYCVVCDDEGITKPYPIVSTIFKGNERISTVGSIVITGNADEFGELTSLSESDIKKIRNQVSIQRCPFCSKKHYVLEVL